MQSTNAFAQASTYQNYHPAQSNHHSLSDDFNDRDEWATGQPRDDEAFLSSSHLSPAVAARERYMARKEAGGSPYGYEAGAVQQRGCFTGRRKWWWIGGAIILIAIIAGAVAGVVASKSSSSNKGVSGVVQSDASDPSKFTKNTALHQSFYGMCYTPLNAQVREAEGTSDAWCVSGI